MVAVSLLLNSGTWVHTGQSTLNLNANLLNDQAKEVFLNNFAMDEYLINLLLYVILYIALDNM